MSAIDAAKHLSKWESASLSRYLLVCFVTLAAIGLVGAGVAGAQLAQDQFEPNDARSSATATGAGDSYDGLTITDADTDYFAVSAEAGEQISAEIDFSHADGDIDMQLETPSGRAVAYATSVSDDESIDHTAETSGTYYVRVYGHNDATNRYDLYTNVEGGVSGGADLRSIAYGETASGEIDTADPDGQRGNYEPVTFSGSAGDVVTIDMTSNDDTYLILQGPDGQELIRDDDGGSGLDSQISAFTLPETGQYTIVATSFSSSDTFEYTLSLRNDGTAEGGADLRSIAYGEAASGEIDAVDPSGQRGNYEPVTFSGSAGDVVTIDMTSDDDTYLILQGPNGQELTRDDDGGSGLNSQISGYTLPETGQYTIIATSYSSSDTFEYTLSLRNDGTAEEGTDLRSIAYGETASGEIDAADPDGQRGNYEPVTFSGSAGDVVTIDMTSDDDTYLILQGPNGQELTRDDDGGFGLNSQISGYTLPETGQYTIIATSYSSSDTFEYTLSLRDDGTAEGGADLRSITYGETASGEIDEADPSGQRGNYEPVTFRGSEGDMVTIEMTSNDDTYLILQGPNGQELTRDDDGGSGLDSQISSFTLPETGQYTIVATSYSSSDTFEYTLSLRDDGTAEGGADLRSITYGETASGEIDAVDPSGQRGNYEPVTFSGSADDIVTIEMTSNDDTYLILQGPNGQELTRDDDGGSGLNSQISGYTLPETGQYTIVATSFSSSDIFEYTLSLRNDGTAEDGTDLRSISVGETASGEIDEADPDGQRGNYEPVTFSGSAGDVVTIDMTSNDDTYLILQGPNGQELTRDDDGGSGLNSQISGYTLPETGQYTIIATSFSSSDTFEYTLSLNGAMGLETPVRTPTEPPIRTPTEPPVRTPTEPPVRTATPQQTDSLSLETNTIATAGGGFQLQITLENTGTETQAVVVNAGDGVEAAGWEIRSHTNDGGTWRDSQGSWLFQSIAPRETVQPTVTIDVSSTTGSVETMRVSAQSNDGQTTAIARINTSTLQIAQAADQNDNNELDDFEVLAAIDAWRSDSSIDGTRISAAQILDLIDLWRQGGV